MIRRPPRSTQSRSSAASDVYKRQGDGGATEYGDRSPAGPSSTVGLPDVRRFHEVASGRCLGLRDGGVHGFAPRLSTAIPAILRSDSGSLRAYQARLIL